MGSAVRGPPAVVGCASARSATTRSTRRCGRTSSGRRCADNRRSGDRARRGRTRMGRRARWPRSLAHDRYRRPWSSRGRPTICRTRVSPHARLVGTRAVPRVARDHRARVEDRRAQHESGTAEGPSRAVASGLGSYSDRRRVPDERRPAWTLGPALSVLWLQIRVLAPPASSRGDYTSSH